MGKAGHLNRVPAAHGLVIGYPLGRAREAAWLALDFWPDTQALGTLYMNRISRMTLFWGVMVLVLQPLRAQQVR